MNATLAHFPYSYLRIFGASQYNPRPTVQVQLRPGLRSSVEIHPTAQQLDCQHQGRSGRTTLQQIRVQPSSLRGVVTGHRAFQSRQLQMYKPFAQACLSVVYKPCYETSTRFLTGLHVPSSTMESYAPKGLGCECASILCRSSTHS